MQRTHELKIWPVYFNPVVSGIKTFEVRKDDRIFKVGDILSLLEYDPARELFTGRAIRKEVTYILKGVGFGIEPGYVVMGLAPGAA